MEANQMSFGVKTVQWREKSKWPIPKKKLITKEYAFGHASGKKSYWQLKMERI